MDLPSTTDQSNNSTYYFLLNEPIIDWISRPLSETKPISPTSSTVSTPTKTPDTPTGTVIPFSQNTMSKTVIVGASVGSVLVVLTIFVACSLAYKHIKRGVEIQIPPDDDKHSSTYLQQYPPVYQQFTPQQLQQQQFVTGMPSPPIQQH